MKDLVQSIPWGLHDKDSAVMLEENHNIHLEICTKTISHLRLSDYKLIFTLPLCEHEHVITLLSATNC
jgi:hypothetical protein